MELPLAQSLFDHPIVVLRIITDSMSVAEVFQLRSLSRRTKRVIYPKWLKTLKKLEKIELVIHREKLEIQTSKDFCFLRFIHLEQSDEKTGEGSDIYVHFEKKNKFIEAVFDDISEIAQNAIWEISSKEYEILWIPQVQRSKNRHYSLFYQLGSNVFERHFNQQKDIEYVLVKSLVLDGSLAQHSPFFLSEALEIQGYSSVAKQALTSFRGKTLIFEINELNVEMINDVLEYMEKRSRSKKNLNDNFKLEIKFETVAFDVLQVLEKSSMIPLKKGSESNDERFKHANLFFSATYNPKHMLFTSDKAIQNVSTNQKIFKEQCAYCFKDPHYKDGLFINLKNYHAFCREHAEIYANHTGNILFVQYSSKKVVVEERVDGEPTSKMTKHTIDADPKYEFEDKYSVVIHPNYNQQFNNVQSVEDIAEAIQTIANCTSAERLALLSSTSNAWDTDIKLITKHANLDQQDNGKRLALSGWRCEAEDCGLDENLWVNLTDGAIRCGRSQFVAEGQKRNGNGHMQEYYAATGYPLVVKLGTISSNLESVDVYSYDEDDAVIDPNLEKHLIHFGLDPAKLEKTAKSTLEMELDMNEKWEWAKCTEDGAVLEPVYGPGYTGLINTGSSCYVNSVLQALIGVESFRTRYGDGALETLLNCPIDNIHNDFNAQFAKVVLAMLSGDYSVETDTTYNNIKPLQFKRVAAGNHPEFSTAKQQDAEEYIRFLFEKITKNSKHGQIDPTYSLRFQMWNRFEDIASQKVRYTEQEDVILRLCIPEQAVCQSVPGTDSRFLVDMNVAIRSFFDTQFVDGYKSPITGEQKGATNTVSMKTFPDYLLFQVSKFAFTNQGVQKKLDVEFEVNDELDLSTYRGYGPMTHEESLPEEPQATSEIPSARGEIDPTLVESIFKEMDSIPLESTATGTRSDAPESSATEAANQKTFKDGSEKYKLIGMISHMGSRPDSGHYVAHMLKDGKWVLFDDEKVTLCQDPPKKLAYIYLYKRV